MLGYGYWAARETAGGRASVGEIGFADFHRGIQPSIDGVPEMGWALASWAHGQGFAVEAIVGAFVLGRLPANGATQRGGPASTSDNAPSSRNWLGTMGFYGGGADHTIARCAPSSSADFVAARG